MQHEEEEGGGDHSAAVERRFCTLERGHENARVR